MQIPINTAHTVMLNNVQLHKVIIFVNNTGSHWCAVVP